MLQSVFKVTTLCMDTGSQSFLPLLNGLIHDTLMQSSPRLNKPLLKMTFLTFPRYSSYSMWVRWANLQPYNVKFLQDLVCQKWSVYFWRSYSKNKNVSVFFETQCSVTQQQFVFRYVVFSTVSLGNCAVVMKYVYVAWFVQHGAIQGCISKF